MFELWPSWLARNPTVRRTAIKLWRVTLRMRRATFANAVLVAKASDGRVLVLRPASGILQLPVKQLDGWMPITVQVDDWLRSWFHQPSISSLVAIEGTPGREGVTFLYAAQLEGAPESEGALWLEPQVAASGLSRKESRYISLCASRKT